MYQCLPALTVSSPDLSSEESLFRRSRFIDVGLVWLRAEERTSFEKGRRDRMPLTKGPNVGRQAAIIEVQGSISDQMTELVDISRHGLEKLALKPRGAGDEHMNREYSSSRLELSI